MVSVWKLSQVSEVLNIPLAKQSFHAQPSHAQVSIPLQAVSSEQGGCAPVSSSFSPSNPCCGASLIAACWTQQVPAPSSGAVAGCVSPEQGHSSCQSHCSKPLPETLLSAPGLARTAKEKLLF